jgi:hypothetical protein
MQKEMRFRVAKDLHKRFKIVCEYRDLSVPRQAAELIRQFVEIQEKNLIADKTIMR